LIKLPALVSRNRRPYRINIRNATNAFTGRIEKVVVDVAPMTPADAAEDDDAQRK
jgi:hypothetical protein